MIKTFDNLFWGDKKIISAYENHFLVPQYKLSNVLIGDNEISGFAKLVEVVAIIK